jgi:DNA-binding response OmpR family regulator
VNERPVALIADSDADIRGLLAALLGRAGFEIVEASDGRKAVALARERAPTVALIDLGLPQLDGYETTRALRALPAPSAMTIFVLTASAREGDRGLALAAGADVYLCKPFRRRELIDRVRELAQT